ncbi:hypothetical protein [Pacificimonas flava]|uniref:NlpC/P60 domain-containing protein n=1 Tax=Pacificimonas flava TaxID=1234595 RepID=M2U3H7_9SPHN|nr:hypothetical protein [Pacificimonas flava]EMD82488.1 hypothetical protein C725_2209 [Pacificimonas flava]MBB5281320.1 cell wall-associated NlpC family hydrolase [Pacificimonas flava]
MAGAFEIVAQARTALGCPARPQGRCPRRGLDCVGLVLVGLAGAGLRPDVPADYSLRADNRRRLADGLRSAGLIRVDAADAAPGDILEFEAGPGQHHLAVHAGRTLIHTDFSLRRVVETTPPPEWNLRAVWRAPEANDRTD